MKARRIIFILFDLVLTSFSLRSEVIPLGTTMAPNFKRLEGIGEQQLGSIKSIDNIKKLHSEWDRLDSGNHFCLLCVLKTEWFVSFSTGLDPCPDDHPYPVEGGSHCCAASISKDMNANPVYEDYIEVKIFYADKADTIS